jgi:pimeloyl-ACP methyl ester carboxylesterase
MMHGKGRASRHAAAVARLAETIPRSETMTFPGLGHAAPEKKPGQIADAVLRFFAAHAKPGAGSRVSNRV